MRNLKKIHSVLCLLIISACVQVFSGCQYTRVQQCKIRLPMEHKVQRLWQALKVEPDTFIQKSGLHIFLKELLHDGVYKLEEKKGTYRIVSTMTSTARCHIRLNALHYIAKEETFLRDLYTMVQKNRFNIAPYTLHATHIHRRI